MKIIKNNITFPDEAKVVLFLEHEHSKNEHLKKYAKQLNELWTKNSVLLIEAALYDEEHRQTVYGSYYPGMDLNDYCVEGWEHTAITKEIHHPIQSIVKNYQHSKEVKSLDETIKKIKSLLSQQQLVRYNYDEDIKPHLDTRDGEQFYYTVWKAIFLLTIQARADRMIEKVSKYMKKHDRVFVIAGSLHWYFSKGMTPSYRVSIEKTQKFFNDQKFVLYDYLDHR